MATEALHPKWHRGRFWAGAHILLLAAFAGLVFANSIQNGYHLDDIYRVKNNAEIERFWPPWRHFVDPLTGTTKPEIVVYRPLVPLSHSLDVQVSKFLGIDRISVFHLSNIVIHAVSAVLLYLLFWALLLYWSRLGLPAGRLRFMAFAGASLFAVHPISGVPVNYIGGRDLLLMMAFLLASLLLYVRMRQRGDTSLGWCAVLGLLAMSMLSKGNATMAFAVVYLFEFLLADGRLADWRPWVRVIAFASVTGIFFAVRWLVWWASAGTVPALGEASSLAYPLTQLKVHLFHNMKNVVWPFEMRPLPMIAEVETPLDPYALGGAAFILGTLALAWYLRRRSPLLAFSIACYWTMLVPSSSVLALRQLARDQRLYPSLAFLCLGLVIALFTLLRHRPACTVAAGLMLYWGASSVFLNEVWRSEESFWARSVRFGGTASAHNNFALAVAARDPLLAEHHYREALRLDSRHVDAPINLGMLYVTQGRSEEGLTLIQQAAERNPDSAVTHYLLSKALGGLGRERPALDALRRAANLNPRELTYQYEAARALQIAGEVATSIPYLERVAAVDPGFRSTLFLLGRAHQRSGRQALAIDMYQRFLEAYPKHVQARINLGYALVNTGDCNAAVAHLERVLALDPGRAAAHQPLAICYLALGDESAAARHQNLSGR